VQKLIKDGHVLVNEKEEGPGYKVRENDSITIRMPEEAEERIIAENIPLNILYKDDYLVVVDKPAGLVVYPAAGHSEGTLMNALLHHCGKMATIGGPLRPGVVHRLDRDTSGVMVVALADEAYYDLIDQFRLRSINRKYLALINGNLKEDAGEIDLQIGRSTSDRKKMTTKTKSGKQALTNWKVIERFGPATLIEAKLGTGRTHQIRVHLSAIGHSVLGDRSYGRKIALDLGRRKLSFPRQMLHAETLGFIHPITKEYMEFSTPVPEDMEKCIRELREAQA
jgi:23S rRNA pseudouridine1911/1915/1917 synthase